MPSRINSKTSDVPIARVDAQDEEQALPIREYLEQNGVAVVLGRKPALPATYHIICGDAAFVKETLLRHATFSVKPFIVLFLRHRETVPAEFAGINAKVAAVDGNRLPAREAAAVFAYFITGDQPVFSVATRGEPMMEVKPVEKNTMSFPRKRESIFGIHDGSPTRARPRPDRGSGMTSIRRRSVFRWFLLLFMALTTPFLWYLVSIGMILGLQWFGVSAARGGDITRLPLIASATRFWVGQGRGALGIAGAPIRWAGGASTVRSHERILSIASDVATGEENVAELLAAGRALAPILFAGPGEEHASLPVVVDRMRLSLEDIASSLGLVGAELRLLKESRAFPFGLGRVRKLVDRAGVEADRALASMGGLRSLLTLFRAAGGFDRKKTYLVLLQNSMELRPTGGFIGSVATMSVEDGMMETPVVQDVYALDGQLKGHVDPPPPIRDVLEQEHWYLRDSNWDPDFSVSGEKAAWFYEKETGSSVDGVIAITTNVLTDLLGVTGPIDLPDYNDRITRDNFFGKSIFYTKADFFPGSTQKKDFLGSLTTAVLTKVTTGSQTDAARVAAVLLTALGSGEIQVWFADGGVQTIADSAGWTGKIAPIALVESNMGVNKVNFFINRSIKSRVDIEEDGAVNGTIAVTYHNTSTDDGALSGGGTYLNYLRAYVPPDALILSVTLDGVEVSHQDETTGGSTVAGLAFTVPPGSTRTIAITYRRGVPIAFTTNVARLAVTFRKQPGVRDTVLDFSIGYPARWKTDESTSTFANIGEVRYNTTLDQTKTFTVTFRK